ncbi:hypothetical protein AAC03nite_39480 [Alicyclobacillus acidoterrestris]|nr:hypothetical protein AAC03nite_39480 [Alicyclobacillus acidoterrestris]
MNKIAISIALSAAIFFSTAGCGTSNTTVTPSRSHTTAYIQNPPFMNKLNLEVVTPSNTFNSFDMNKSVYTNVPVYDSSGKKISLDVDKQPIFFEAYWCPHCQRTLVLWNKNHSKLQESPAIVSSGFEPGTTLSQAVALSRAEVNALGLKGFKIYFLLGSAQKYTPAGIPSLIFKDKNQIEMLAGEHTLLIWEKALRAHS